MMNFVELIMTVARIFPPNAHENTTEIQAIRGHSDYGINATCVAGLPSWTTFPIFVHCEHDPSACLTGKYPFDNIPVREDSTGIDFFNAQCAFCNGVTSASPWKITAKTTTCPLQSIN